MTPNMLTSGEARFRRGRWAAMAVAMLLVQGLAVGLPAMASVPATPARTWGVGPATATSASVGKPRVLAILPVGDRIVVGGSFDAVIDPGGTQYPAKNIAVFSASTGAADLSFKGSANNTVTSLASDGAGTVFVGGTFGTMNGATRKGLAALDVATGNLQPWAPSIIAPGQVDTLAYAAGAVYAGGNFAAITGGSGTSKAFLAKVDAQTGAVDTAWAAAPNDRVRAMSVAADGSGRLFIGGDFTSVSAKTKTNKIAAVFTTGTGAVDIVFQAGPTNQTSYAPVFDLTSDSTRVYAAVAGSGGACTAQNAKTGATLWSDHSNGNLQSVRLSGGLLYCAGHFSGTGSFLGQTRYKVAAVDPATGALNAFAPNVNSSQGPWALAADPTHLYMGGDFSSISGVPQPHFAMFIDTAAQTPPRPPASLTAQASDGQVQLAWKPPSSDGGSALMKYKLYRATTPGGEALTKTPLATLAKTTTSYTDTTVTNGTTYSYVVTATNALGTSGPSNEATTTPQGSTTITPPGAPTGLTATTPAGLIRLTWAAPTNTGGAPITSYRVYRGTTAGGEDLTTPVGTATTTTFDDTTVTAGTTYSYVVTAVNTAGQGPPSGEVAATATTGTATAPGQPTLTGTLGTAPAGGPAADLQWTIPADGGSPISKYVIIRDGVRLITLTATPTGPTTYTDTTITTGTHIYQVKAVNSIGSGPLSNKASITSP
jgi:fibronectin type 3 domain-containing protein